MQLGHSPVGTRPMVHRSVRPKSQVLEAEQPISSQHDQGHIAHYTAEEVSVCLLWL